MGEHCEKCDAFDEWDDEAKTLRHPNGRFVRALNEYEAREKMATHAHEPELAPVEDPDSGFAFVGDALDPAKE